MHRRSEAELLTSPWITSGPSLNVAKNKESATPRYCAISSRTRQSFAPIYGLATPVQVYRLGNAAICIWQVAGVDLVHCVSSRIAVRSCFGQVEPHRRSGARAKMPPIASNVPAAADCPQDR